MKRRAFPTKRSARAGAVTAVLLALLVLAACSSGPERAPAPQPPAPTEPAVSAATEAAPLPTSTPAPEAEPQEAAPAVAEEAVAEVTVAAQPQLPLDQIVLDLQPVAAGLEQPLFVAHAGDGSGRIFIVEKPGVIRILQDGQVLDTPFLDIRDRVRSSGSEQGLLGLAFSPDYATSGYFFVNYTDQAGSTVIARFQAAPGAPNTADPTGEFTVMTMQQPAGNHNGGMLAFGPDGYLYIGTGDGGAAFDRFENGQNPATLLGKMLRVDVTSDPAAPYLIPPDNPWVGEEVEGPQVRDEIWAFGLRNPWRYSFDRLTQDLWIADVGQNQFEEINFTPAGASGGLNYGWPIQEATSCVQGGDACDSTGLVQPVLEYDHSGHCSVTGGYVYRGGAYPALQGTYFYGDYCSGAIWAAVPAENGAWQSAIVHRSGLMLSSFGEDEAGELYLTDISGGGVYRLGLAE